MRGKIWTVCDIDTHYTQGAKWTDKDTMEELCIPMTYFSEEDQFHYKMSGVIDEETVRNVVQHARSEP